MSFQTTRSIRKFLFILMIPVMSLVLSACAGFENSGEPIPGKPASFGTMKQASQTFDLKIKNKTGYSLKIHKVKYKVTSGGSWEVVTPQNKVLASENNYTWDVTNVLADSMTTTKWEVRYECKGGPTEKYGIQEVMVRWSNIDTVISIHDCSGFPGSVDSDAWDDVHFESKNNDSFFHIMSGNCLDLNGAAVPGADIVVSTCRSHSDMLQNFVWGDANSLRPMSAKSLCVQAEGDSGDENVKLVLAVCDSSKLSQRWGTCGQQLYNGRDKCMTAQSITGGSILQSTCTGSQNQRFYKMSSNGYYTGSSSSICPDMFPSGTASIQLKKHGKCMDLAGGNTSNGGNIQQWSCVEGHSNQQFSVVSDGEFYQIKHTASGKCLDVSGGNSTNGTNIQLWDCQSGNNNQRFSLDMISSLEFMIRNKKTGKCLDLRGGSSSNGTNIQLWDCVIGEVNQRFVWKGQYFPQSTGIKIRTKKMGRKLELENGNTSNGSNIEITSVAYYEFPNKIKFSIVPEGSYYRILHTSSGKCFDVAGGSSSNGTNIQLWSCVTNQYKDNQLFSLEITPSPRFQFIIRNKKTGKCLDLANGNTDSGNNIQLWECTSSSGNQNFFISQP